MQMLAAIISGAMSGRKIGTLSKTRREEHISIPGLTRETELGERR